MERLSCASAGPHYEQLRRQIVSGTDVIQERWGLNLLLTQGLTAWIRGWADQQPVQTPDVRIPATEQVALGDLSLPDAWPRQMTSALVEMILRRTAALA